MALGITPEYSGVDHDWKGKRPQACAADPDNHADSPTAVDDSAQTVGLASSNTSYGLKKLYAPKSAKQNPIIWVTSMYQAFIRRPDQLQSGCADIQKSSGVVEPGAAEEEKDYVQLLRDHMEQMFIKLQNGEIEPKFQIGSQSFTIKEWEKFLEKFDEVEEAIRELQQQDIEKRKAKAEEDARLQMLTSETVQVHFPLSETNVDGTPKEDLYLTAIDQNGIRCSRPGSAVYEWEVTFASKAQYQQAKDLLEWANTNVGDCRFAANQSFWEALLSGNLDGTAFRKFLEGAEDRNAGRTAESALFVDASGRQWADYMNHPDARFYISKEMAKKAVQELREYVTDKNVRSELKQSVLPTRHMGNEGSLGYTEICQRYYPGYGGEAIFCEYPGGPLYTAEEAGRRMYEKALQIQEANHTSIPMEQSGDMSS